MSDQNPIPLPPGDPTGGRAPRKRMRRGLKITLWSVGVFLGLGIIGSFLPTAPAPSNSAAPVTPTASPGTQATHTAAPLTHPAAPPPATTAAPVPASNPAPPVGDPLTGFGALVTVWNANHAADDAYDPGTVYGADPALPQVNGREGAKYTAVQPLGGRVTTYTVNFQPGALPGVQQLVAAEFPSDARVLWTQRADTCTEVEYASATVHGVVGNTGVGDALVVFKDVQPDGSSAPTPSVFNQALIADFPAATAADAVGC
jgi:hypothetical protein